MNDLSWTLQTRRTVFPFRVAFPSSTRERLLISMDENLRVLKNGSSSIGPRSFSPNSDVARRFLGVFTGQGAQWPMMGRELLLASHFVEKRIGLLEQSLADLSEPPSWSLKSEILAEASCSRVQEAEIAQPLCTAVQIVLVDLLRCAGITFDAVVGHSSGEIAAVYAAGIISSSDAMRIAYYRGLHAKYASGTGGCAGAMMAVGMSYPDALDFCQTDKFIGRLGIAASNAPMNTTLAGDEDAIKEARDMIGEKCFTKLLKVDRAYHSYHMNLCAESYVQSIGECNVHVQCGNASCVWISSVFEDNVVDLDSLKAVYWKDNMVKTVLFSHAIEHAIRNNGPFDMMVEVGPHPSLKTSLLQVCKSVAGSTVPYCGLMRRGNSSLETFSDGLGCIWANFGRQAVIDFDGYRQAFKKAEDKSKPRVLKGLPAYSWNHEKAYWSESRTSRNARFRDDQVHELLGRRCPDDSEHEMRWRNIILLEELPWLQGHVFQGQVVFPGAAYVTMAWQASRSASRKRSVKLLEFQDICFFRAMVIHDTSAGIETHFSLKYIEDKDNTLTADFTCSSSPAGAKQNLEKNCSGRLHVIFGEPSIDTLPPRLPISSSTISVDVDRFYRTLSDLGFEYDGLFRGLASIQRTTQRAISFASWPWTTEIDFNVLEHPALLDVGFQSVFASISSISRVQTPYLPTKIRRIRFNPASAHTRLNGEAKAFIDAYATDFTPATRHSPPTICGDIDMVCGEGTHMDIQVEGLSLKSVSEAGPSSDHILFSQIIWDFDIAAGDATANNKSNYSEVQEEHLELLERLAYFYFREWDKKIPRQGVPMLEWHHSIILEYLNHVLTTISHDQHPTIKKEWAFDTQEELLLKLKKFPDTIDFHAARTIGEKFLSVIRGETTTLEILTKNDMLDRIYSEGLGMPRLYGQAVRMVEQIAHRHPRMRILEIGAGTGGMTENVLQRLGGKFLSYTFTDISTGFFEKSQERFAKFAPKILFKALNIEEDVTSQGFAVHSFDMVIAANVLHATRKLERTLEHTRSLLRPGGYLVLLEITGHSLRVPLVMLGMPGWWLGRDDGRRLSPGASLVRWDHMLRETGFSGIDVLFYDAVDPEKHTFSAILSQAIDNTFNMIRQPFSSPELVPQVDQFLIVGGKTLNVSRLIHSVCGLLRMWNNCMVRVPDLTLIDTVNVSSSTTILCLTELDEPVFKSITPANFRGMQQLFDNARQVLWVTQGFKDGNPYSCMIAGVLRVYCACYAMRCLM